MGLTAYGGGGGRPSRRIWPRSHSGSGRRVAMFWWQPGFASLPPVIFVAGGRHRPTLVTGCSLIDHLAPPERRTECMTWLSSAIGVGLAIGAPAAGRLIDLSGARAGYLLAAASGAAAFVTCLAGLGRLRTSPPGTGGDPAPAAQQSYGQDRTPGQD